MNWTPEQLAERIAANPSLACANRGNSPLKSPASKPKKPSGTLHPVSGDGAATASLSVNGVGSSDQPGPNKYHAKRTTVDGIVFASGREAKRYGELKLLERGGKIRDLVCQWRYALEVEGVLVCHYVADFVYFDIEKSRPITEDCKGMRTPIYKLKKKLMFAVYKIAILET